MGLSLCVNNRILLHFEKESLLFPFFFSESACYTQQWYPGKTFLALNISTSKPQDPLLIVDESMLAPKRLQQFSLGTRKLVPYSAALHSQRFLYLPGHEQNRLLTHFYSFLFFTSPTEERRAKRFMRDRLRYHDQVIQYILSISL